MSIRVVPFGDEHVAGMELTIGDPDVLRFTGVPEPTPPGWVGVWQRRYAEHDDRQNFAILDDQLEELGGFVGWAVRFGISREDRQLELGYATSPWARGRGVATEALRQLTRAALDEGFQRLELQIQVVNSASQRIAEKVGYTYEGTRRSVHHKNGERVDLQMWSMLPGELA